MATIYYTASSLDGFIVDDAGSLDWLLSRSSETGGPFDYATFMKSVGALVMGARTYEWVVNYEPGDWPYEQPTWVVTHRPQIMVEGHPVQTFHGEVADLHPELVSAAAGNDVWVVGGGATAAQFVAEGLVDEMIVTYAPCSLGSGTRLLPARSEWAQVASGVNGDFVCAHWRKVEQSSFDGGHAEAPHEFS